MVPIFVIFAVTLILPNIDQTASMVVSPCKVRNLVTQPSVGTSLKTKTLINIIQLPPVFTQNVMVGICENRNQNISTGRAGEFYICQQRYSIVEVYTAETVDGQQVDAPQTQQQSSGDKFQSIKYVRESVIIESGCDFIFNLYPFLTANQNPADQSGNTGQDKIFLRSPYHPSGSFPYRQPAPTPSPSSSTIAYGGPQTVATASGGNKVPNSYPGAVPGSAGRAGEEEIADNLTLDIA